MSLNLPEITGVLILVAVGVGLVLALAATIKMRYKVVEPNSALIIAGTRSKEKTKGTPDDPASSGGLKVVQGGGVFVWPIIQKPFRLSLQTMELNVDVRSVPSKNKVQINVDTTANIRIGDTIEDINAAATRFLGWNNDQIGRNAQEILAGSLRSIIGTMTVEEIIEDRETFSEQVQSVASKELRPMGLVIDVMNVKEVTDDQEYIRNLGVTETERVRKEAEKVKANTQLEITQNQLAADQAQAEKTRDTAIKKAEYQAEQDTAQMKAAQAGPLAEAEARMAVVQKQTEVSALESAMKESELQTEIIKPAEASAKKTQIDADAAAKKTEIDAAAAAKKTEIDAKAAATQTELAAKAAATQTELAAKARATQLETEGKAQAAATKATGEAAADAAKAMAAAEGAKVREVATAKAEGLSLEADALNKLSEASVQLRQLEVMPEIVGQAAQAIAGIDGLYVAGESGMNAVLGFVPQMVNTGMAMATGNYTRPQKVTEQSDSPAHVGEATTEVASQPTAESKTPVLDAQKMSADFTEVLSMIDGRDLLEKLANLRNQGGNFLEAVAGSDTLDKILALAESIDAEMSLDDQVTALFGLLNADPKLANQIVRLLPTAQSLIKKYMS
jgi:flotillin